MLKCKGRLDDQTVNAHASCAGGREFETQAGEILYSIANGSPPPEHYTSSCVPWRYDAEIGNANSLHALT